MMSFSYSLFCVAIGFILARLYDVIVLNYNIVKIKKIFDEINDNLASESVKFISKIGTNTIFTTRLNRFGDVTILQESEKNEVFVIKDKKVIYVSSSIKPVFSKVVADLNSQIDYRFRNFLSREEIENTKKEIDKSIWDKKIQKIYDPKRVNIADLLGSLETTKKKKIEISLNLDDILDRITKIGYENLEEEEKEFLRKY